MPRLGMPFHSRQQPIRQRCGVARVAVWWTICFLNFQLMVRAADMIGAATNLWWSFRPIARPVVPEGPRDFPMRENPIDAFIDVKLAERGLTPNPRATRRERIRRASIQLLGLPPSYEEVLAFENDRRPDAWERLIQQMLARPEYGERWARHWLDVVRFAQSNGYERDGEKPEAWRYRDYVVRAFNNDKPYDQFVREQIAGDELDPWSADAVIATGYARLGVLDDEPDDNEMAVFDELDDVLSTTGVAFLGLTLGCARCHDHKFDPIPHADYYRLLSFFRGVQPMRHLSDPVQSTAHVPLASAPEVQAWRSEWLGRLKALELSLNNAATESEKKRAKSRLEEVKRELPPFEHALALREVSAMPEATFVLKRGNAYSRGDAVQPGFPAVILGRPTGIETSGQEALESKSHLTQSSGRRLVLADWIASPENPLTARVIVNRVWHHHFGRGIVSSTGDFGRAGMMPTHPELLDWLADEFIRQGWSIKRLHQLILTSDVYQRSSATSLEAGLRANATDPANEWLWRQNLRRMEAETIRDSVLYISGQLNRVPGGRGFFPRLSGEVLAGGSRPGTDWEVSSRAEQSRRSLYAYIRRTQAVPFLEALDYANNTSPLTERPTTTVAPQALLLLNDDFMHDQAVAFAKRLLNDAKSTGDLARPGATPQDVGHSRPFSDQGVLQHAIRVALARDPSARELAVARQFLDRQREQFGSMKSRLTFRADVPGTMNVSYFNQLAPEAFVVAPDGWTRHRGHWPDSYEGNRIMERSNGPFALWPNTSMADGLIQGRLTLHTGLESGGILLRATADEGRARGYEVVLDARQQRIGLNRLGTNTSHLALREAYLPVGSAFSFKVELEGATIRVWLNDSLNPALVATDPLPPETSGRLGFRAWGAPLSVDALQLQSHGQREALMPSPEASDPDRRALEAFCLLLLNLNEVVYVD